MNCKTLAALILLMPFLLAFSGPTYIGAKKCKICHKVEFASWQKLAHAKAFERLSAEEKGKAECLKCHATGGHAKFPGVQCEACHGPGSGYKSLKVMKDSAKSPASSCRWKPPARDATKRHRTRFRPLISRK